jgi:hypothetical protein
MFLSLFDGSGLDHFWLVNRAKDKVGVPLTEPA